MVQNSYVWFITTGFLIPSPLPIAIKRGTKCSGLGTAKLECGANS